MTRLPAKLLLSASLVFAMLFVVAARAAIAQSLQTTPTSVRATYKVYKAGIWIGTIDEHFTREGDNYKIVSDTETAGPLRLFLRDQLTVTSQGTVDASGLKPKTYQFARRNDLSKNISSTFDWNKHQLVSRRNGEIESFELPKGTQDRASAMYQFMFITPRAIEVSVWMSQGRKPEIYHYRKQGEPVLTVNNENIATVYYAREAAAGESKAHLWLAKDKHYLPVKILFEDTSGGSVEQMLVSLHTE
jgi:hypothetical protein